MYYYYTDKDIEQVEIGLIAETVASLRKIAKKDGLKGYSRLSKNQLVSAIARFTFENDPYYIYQEPSDISGDDFYKDGESEVYLTFV